MGVKTGLLCAATALWATAGLSQDTGITPNAEFMFEGRMVSIVRDNTLGPTLAAKFASAAPECAQNCFGPIEVAAGVKTLGEQEVLSFLMGHVVANTGLMVDARTPQDRTLGHIPGSVSLPASAMRAQKDYRDQILTVLGARTGTAGLTFENARHLLVYDIGPASNDAETLITQLLAAGYPAERINYYRGGLLMWAALGLSIQTES
jgi:rhodanese-related sulfurtransferase